ncbi:MAG: sulfite exporter TauE/SafE family protein [Magnetococcales bacterium]|nr:sulfite exporter TauE/SafE family protein [Magnetococcales bacterium]
MNSVDWMVVAGIYYVAAYLKGVTGLGFATACLPMLVIAFDLKTALPLVIIPSLASNMLVMVEAGHFKEMVVRFRSLYLSALVGLFVGLYFLDRMDSYLGGAVLGVTLILYTLWSVGFPNVTLLNRRQESLLCIPVGLSNGIINGITGSQIVPVLPYLLSLPLDHNRFVQAINSSATLSSLVMMVGLSHLGLLTWDALPISLAGTLVVHWGVRGGAKVRRRLAPGTFKRALLFVTALLGVILILKWAAHQGWA